MNRINKQAAAILLTALIGGGAVLAGQTPASAAGNVNDSAQVEQAIAKLVSQGVLQGDGNGQMRAERRVTNAEMIKMIVLALELAPGQAAAVQPGDKWYTSFVNTAVEKGLLVDLAGFKPNEAADGSQLAAWVAKALERDVKSVDYWMSGLGIGKDQITRGDAASLLVLAEQSIRSEAARIVSIQALNGTTFEVTFDQPLTLADETTAAAQANFVFDQGIKLVNQPRLKTGSMATYIVPVQTMKPGATYTLNYKGKQTFQVAASAEKIQLKSARQVTNDTFEVDSLRTDGVIDYGYVISAYAAGRGANAVVLEEGNRLGGQKMQIISSLATRQATLTPEGGQPITVNYVGFTQSTDGKQEPKFRLPAGTTLQPGVKYAVTSDWFEVKENTFVAQNVEPLQLAAVSQLDAAAIAVTLSQDPGDELFAYRSVQLKGTDGTVLTAQYRVQTRKGDTGVFDLQNGAKLAAGVTYEVTPVGSWAVTEGTVNLDAK